MGRKRKRITDEDDDLPVSSVHTLQESKVENNDKDLTLLMPDDVAIHVFNSFLDPKSQQQLSVANKHWNTIETNYVTKHLARKLFPDGQKSMYKDALWFWKLTAHHYPRERMDKTSIAKLFRLTGDQCSSLPCIVHRNHHRSSSVMYLIKFGDAFKSCMKRHGSVEGLEAYNDKLVKRKRACFEKKDQRHQDLMDALAKQDIFEVRSDSNLIDMWLDEPTLAAKSGWNLQKVVRRYCEVRFLFDHCAEFQDRYQKLKEERDNDRDHLQDNWHDRDAHDYFHATWDNVDMVACCEKGIQFPAIWPWKKSEPKSKTKPKKRFVKIDDMDLD
jgi:hypothetical protein